MLFTEYHDFLHQLQAMKMIFLKSFLIFIFKNPNLADIFTNLTENLLKNIELRVHGVCFFPSLVEGAACTV